MKSFCSIRWRELSLKKKGTNSIVDGLYYFFRFFILLGGVWTREFERYFIIRKVFKKLIIVVFIFIVIL